MAARVAWSLGAVLVLATPRVLDTFWMSMLIQILVFGLLALSVDLLVGHTGMVPLCHAAFFTVAAYTTAILEVRHGQGFVVSAVAGVVAAGLFALVFALSVRTSGVYFILLTLSLGYVVWGVAMRWTSFTGGENGVSNVPAPQLGGLSLERLADYYYLVLAVVVLMALGYRLLVRAPFGLVLRGIRESESRMRALGYRVFVHKLAAFVLSGLIAGVAGVLYTYWNRFVSPASAAFHASVEPVFMVILGGAGTILGPFLGSAIIIVIRSYGSAYFVEWWMTAMGLVFIATVLWAPHGLLGLGRGLRWRSGERAVPVRGEAPRAAVASVAGPPGLGETRAVTPAVETVKLCRSFGGVQAVAGATLTVPAGQRRAIIGPNGAGKTTLFNCLTGVLQPTSGRVLLFGRDVTRVPDYQRARMGVARTYQITNVFAGLTALENVILAVQGTSREKWILHRPVEALAGTRVRALEELERVGLGHRAATLVRLLSYGERRQLEMALALASRPRVLLLDEPTAGLASAERQRIAETITRVPRSVTVILIEHDMSVVMGLADEITVLHRGAILLEGPPETVQADANVREVYLGQR